MERSTAEQASETALIRRALDGSGAAWEDLMRLHQEPVFRFAYLLLGDPDEAEDAAQEAFIRAYQALDRFELGRPLRPWLLSIVANLARNRRRSLGRYLAAINRLASKDETVRAKAAIEELSAERMQAQTLWQAVRKLDPAGQEIIYLRFFLDLPLDETAQILGIAVGTVKSRSHRAINRLKQIIQRDYPTLLPEGELAIIE
jgi:RNA polymerase sigma-70 factor (ECF subfamily)